jgi:hypothetical protein
MPLLNYTTTIAATKTVGEIQTLLAKAGASRIMVEYDAKAEPSALFFELRGQGYRLPCRNEAVFKALKADRGVPARLTTPEQANRVGWRILKDWTEAQLAIIQTGMVAVDEVFMPYQVMANGATLYEHYVSNDRLLTMGSKQPT